MWQEEFDKEFGHLYCGERISKCNCTEPEHELRSRILDIKDFITKLIAEERAKVPKNAEYIEILIPTAYDDTGIIGINFKTNTPYKVIARIINGVPVFLAKDFQLHKKVIPKEVLEEKLNINL